MPQRPKAVLFDVDGTLIDSNDAHTAAWEAALSEAGHHIPAKAIRDLMGMGADNLVPTLIPGSTPEQADALGEGHNRFFNPMLPLKPFPGARDLLQRARDAGLTVVLASSASAEELDQHLDALDARDLIHAATNADDVQRTKPAPDIFAAALEKAGVSAADAVVVGDSPHDIAAAKKLGLGTVALRCGGFPNDALGDAAAIYDGPADLLARFDLSPLAGG